MGLEPTNLLTASQALYQLSYAPGAIGHVTSPIHGSFGPRVQVSLCGGGRTDSRH